MSSLPLRKLKSHLVTSPLNKGSGHHSTSVSEKTRTPAYPMGLKAKDQPLRVFLRSQAALLLLREEKVSPVANSAVLGSRAGQVFSPTVHLFFISPC